MRDTRPCDSRSPRDAAIAEDAARVELCDRRTVTIGACALLALTTLAPFAARAQDVPLPGASQDLPGKVHKDVANYTFPSPNEKVCAGCINFRVPTGSCTKVAGEIEPTAWCELWRDA